MKTAKNIIVDGYNLIYQFPELRKWMERDLEGARQSLITRLSDHASRMGAKITVVFDGDDRIQDTFDSMPNVKVLFSQLPDTADHVIHRMIDRITNPNEWLVISSDNEIVRYAKLNEIATAPSRGYSHDISSEPTHDAEKKYKHSMSEEELEEWIQIFQQNHDDS
jgi:predicted RNA-binding protein with PIN domain